MGSIGFARGEIGLRRAIGATPFDISVQLFMEAMGLAGVGVLAGLMVDLGGASIAEILWGHR